MPQNVPKTAPPDQSKKPSRGQAAESLRTLQKYIGLLFFASAAFGVYLLATDQSLWILAVSHAIGLVVIAVIDVGLGILSFISYRQVFIPSLVWAGLTFLLQLGDIITAPQYGMTMLHFAKYLFGLWAFDALLGVQVIAIIIGVLGLEHFRTSARKKRQSYFDMGIKDTRRSFLQFVGAIGILAALAGVLGVADALTTKPQLSTTTANNGLPAGAIANSSQLQKGQYVFFEFPAGSGTQNILMRRASDGSLVAINMSCTHVCCTCNYDSYSSQFVCPCHGSIFDDTGRVLRGPAPIPLPTVELTIDNAGNIFPKSFNGSSPCLQ